MTRFRVAVHIVPRRGILDPQGKAVADALHSLGFNAITDAHVGRHIVLEMDAKDQAAADAMTRTMCQKLLANPVTEDFEIASVTNGARRPEELSSKGRRPEERSDEG